MLINCVVYQDGKRLGEISPREIHGYVSRPDCFVWVALRAQIRSVLDKVTIADLVSGKLPKEIVAMTEIPDAWVSQ